jgi:hypothetical protein
MQKKWLILLSTLLAMPVALADLGIISRVWDKIMYIGDLSYFFSNAGAVVALTRLLLGIVVFTLFFAVFTVVLPRKAGTAGTTTTGVSIDYLNKNQAGIISAVLAIMVMIFIPAEVILAVGTGWATLVSLLLVGAPVVAIGILIWKIDAILGVEVKDKEGKAFKKETKGTILIKLVLCLVLLWILTAMRYHVGLLGGGSY